MILQNRSVLLGVTGGIAAFKAVTLCSHLVKRGALVDVIMTDAARQFVTPLTFQSLSHRPVATEMFALLGETDIGHVSLARRADLMVIAPATANTIAKLAAGMADNMVTATMLTTEAPILLAPSMETHMWSNPLTQDNLARLIRFRDVTVVGPAEGGLASGATGPGRMAEPEDVLDAACWALARRGPLAGRKIIVTAGGTREPLDPIRFLGNRSSGRMGYALARAARDGGAHVTLISTTGQPAPFGVEWVPVQTAAEMADATLDAFAHADALLMAAAVADYRLATTADQKIKKAKGVVTLDLVRTTDILAQIADLRRADQVVVGFAAETQDLLQNARDKLQRKRLDLIVANDARQAMGADTNQVALIGADGSVRELPVLPKETVAEQILDRVTDLLTA